MRRADASGPRAVQLLATCLVDHLYPRVGLAVADVLERAGLVTRSNVGTSRPVRIEAGPMREAADWLEKYREFWEKSYQRLDALLEILQTPVNTDKPAKATTTSKKQRKDDDA